MLKLILQKWKEKMFMRVRRVLRILMSWIKQKIILIKCKEKIICYSNKEIKKCKKMVWKVYNKK